MTKSKKEMGHVYIVTNKLNGKIYIGQTIRSIQTRLKEHQLESSKCRAFAGAIKKHGWKNFHIEWYECSVDELNKHEKWMIQLMGTLSPGGYNLMEGGGSGGKRSEETKRKISEAQLGKIVSEEIRQKISEALRGEKHPMWGEHHSEETKRKISESQLGISKSDEARQKMSESHIGKTRSKESRQKQSESTKGDNNHKSKRVYQYNLDDAFLGSFGSCGEAARHLIKTDGGSTIRACARGKRKTAYKFKWSYIQY